MCSKGLRGKIFRFNDLGMNRCCKSFIISTIDIPDHAKVLEDKELGDTYDRLANRDRLSKSQKLDLPCGALEHLSRDFGGGM